MSMSTPLNNLPLKTQTSNEENTDLNDPMVQDVLNEFQEELLMSQKPNTSSTQQVNTQSTPPPPPMPHPPQNIHSQPPYPPHLPPYPPPHMHIPPPPIHYRPLQNKQSENQFPYNLYNMEILQKTLIILIVVILIYSSCILPLLYDKVPCYVSDFMESYDFFIKSMIIFIAIYFLFIFEFI